ncbi:hypothetical protein AQ902_14600 [Burkholderia pseudomallei]|nr:hypothetical protein AM256_19190 [Burkholderia pseudomallei]ALC01889.1 hypothetical protein AM257_19215 [Burkholderia pseudomallei]ANW54454.1 hypothetical protein A7U58_20025 [Burkholderia pseudomallei]ANW60404.1 hypothetical protein A7U59_19975 [Burkholderia pseudomallei]KIX35555.1 hypothetical protein SZ28_26410 [Burkholderia pseudomallei]
MAEPPPGRLARRSSRRGVARRLPKARTNASPHGCMHECLRARAPARRARACVANAARTG